MHGSRSGRGPLAALVLAPDLELDVFPFDLRHPSTAAVWVARLVDPAVAHVNRFQRSAVVEPALAVILRIVEVERSRCERDQERRRRFLRPARVGVANGLDKTSYVTSFDGSCHLGAVDADSCLDPFYRLRGSDHRPRGRP